MKCHECYLSQKREDLYRVMTLGWKDLLKHPGDNPAVIMQLFLC